MKKLLIALLMFSFIFLFGCSFIELKPHLKLGCCNLKEAGFISTELTPPNLFTQCNMTGEISEGINRTVDINSCDWENLTTCNVTVYRIGKNGRSPLTTKDDEGNEVIDYKIIPICSDRETKCIQSNCTAMVCGPFKYDPTPLPGYGDLNTLMDKMKKDASEKGEFKGLPTKKDKEQAAQLYNTECLFFPMDTKLQRVFENTKGSNMNIFRIGIGKSFEEYKHYKYFFPISDVYCNVNSMVDAAKDRYMNYLLSDDEYKLKKSGSLKRTPVDKVTDDGFCLVDEESPFLGYHYGKGKENFGVEQRFFTLSDNKNIPDYKTITTTSEIDDGAFVDEEIDKDFYKNFLRYIYRSEIAKGMKSDPPIPAPYECELPTDCYSGYCNTQDYFRGLCKKKDGSWAECSCNPYTKKCRGVRTNITNWDSLESSGYKLEGLAEYYNSNRPTNAYLQIEKLKIKIALVALNPDCDSAQTGGCDEAKIDATCWYKEGDRLVKCVDWEPSRDVIICSKPDENNKTKCIKDKKDIDCTWIHRYNDHGIIKCTIPSSYEMSCIISLEGTAKCGTGDAEDRTSAQYCVLKEGYTADTINPYTCDHPSIFGCSWDAENKKITCPNIGDKPCVQADPEEHPNVYHCGNPTFKSYVISCIQTDSGRLECEAPEEGFFKYSEDMVEDIVKGLLAAGSLGKGISGTAIAAAVNELLSAGKDNHPVNFELKHPENFPTDIIFVDEQKSAHNNMVVGYSLLEENEFLQSDFARACGITENDKGTFYAIEPAVTPYTDKCMGCCEGTNDVFINTWGFNGFLRPEPVPSNLGIELIDGGECHAFGDNWAHWAAVREFIVIMQKNGQIGDCVYNKNTGMLEAKTYGWCEPCSYLTMAEEKPEKQSLGLIINTHTLLKEGVQPVLYLLNKSSLEYPFEVNGPSILMVGKINLSTAFRAKIDATAINSWKDDEKRAIQLSTDRYKDLKKVLALLDRVEKAKDRCPKCLIGIELDNGPMGSKMYPNRYSHDIDTIERLFTNPFIPPYSPPSEPTLGQKLYEKLDVIGFKFYPSEYTKADPSLCSDPNRNQILLDKIKEISSYIRWEANKSPLITDIKVDRDDACWKKQLDKSTGAVISDPEYDFLSYLFLKHGVLAKTGMLGIIYKDTDAFTKKIFSKTKYTEEFCTIQKATGYYRSDMPITIYNKVFVSDEVICEPCTDSEISLGMCNKTCMNGVECKMPNDAKEDKKYKCPKRRLPTGCKKCKDTNYLLNCSIYYANGTIQKGILYNTYELTDLYADIIGAIPAPYKCCLNDSNGEFTYYIEETRGARVSPIIFPSNGSDPTQDCGMPELDIVTSGVCNINIPIKNYKIKCKIE